MLSHYSMRTPAIVPAHESRSEWRARLRKHLIVSPTSDLPTAIDAFQNHPATFRGAHQRHAIVVLGVPLLRDGTPSESLMARVRRAAEMAQIHPSAFVVVTGGAAANEFVEAQGMAQELIILGVESRRILLEPFARTTLDNAAFTFRLLEGLWPHAGRQPVKLTLVSEPYHAVRALRLFAAAGRVFDFKTTLHIAASDCGHQPARSENERPVRIGNRTLSGGFQAKLGRCVEEQRRISCGW